MEIDILTRWDIGSCPKGGVCSLSAGGKIPTDNTGGAQCGGDSKLIHRFFSFSWALSEASFLIILRSPCDPEAEFQPMKPVEVQSVSSEPASQGYAPL